MPLPRWVARINLRVTNHILGPIAEFMPGMGIVIHEGRKTRRRYRTPVMVFRDGERFVIALTYGAESQWVQNVVTNGGCDLESRGRTYHLVQPRLIHDQRRSLMPGVVRVALGAMNVADFLELTIQGAG